MCRVCEKGPFVSAIIHGSVVLKKEEQKRYVHTVPGTVRKHDSLIRVLITAGTVRYGTVHVILFLFIELWYQGTVPVI